MKFRFDASFIEDDDSARRPPTRWNGDEAFAIADCAMRKWLAD
jgi:hypothetical protein